jgi:putative membrane protein
MPRVLQAQLVFLRPPEANMERVQELLSGSGAFAIAFLASLALLGTFIFLYSVLTARHEMTLIRNGNNAAALSFGGAIVGFSLPIGKAVAQSVSLVDLVAWAAVAFVAQLVAYGATAILLPHLRKALADDHLASGILLAALAIAIGLLNAASMSL